MWKTKNSQNKQVVRMLIPTVAAWLVGKLLETNRGRKFTGRLDSGVAKARRKSMWTLHGLSCSARRNPALLLGGLAALVTATGLLATATVKK